MNMGFNAKQVMQLTKAIDLLQGLSDKSARSLQEIDEALCAVDPQHAEDQFCHYLQRIHELSGKMLEAIKLARGAENLLALVEK